MVARAPQDVHAHRHDPRRRFAPDAAQNAPEATRSPQRARSRADASQKPAPRARRPLRVWWRAHRRTFTPTDTIRAGASRQTPPRTRQKPPEARSAPEAGQTPARSPYRARAVRCAYGGARTAGRSRPQTRSAPALRARRRLERARSRQKRRTRQEPGRSPHRARAVRCAYGGARPDRRTSPHRRYAPDAAQNAPGASRKRLPHATSLQHDHRPGPDSTATPGHCVTATARAPVAPDDAGAQRRSSVAVAPPGHIVCTQVSCESASPFSFTSTQADTDAARPAFTP